MERAQRRTGPIGPLPSLSGRGATPVVRWPGGLALAVAGPAVLVLLWALVAVRATDGWDRAALDALRLAAGSGAAGWARAVTRLGDAAPLALVTVVAGLVLARWGGRRVLLLPGAAALAGWLLSDTVKIVVARPRPPAAGWLVPVGGYAFPSGHTSSTAAGYLTVAVLTTRLVRSVTVRRVVVLAAVAVTVAVGVSRVLLGVHWPTDVVAGWALGATVALAATVVVQLLAPEAEPQ